VNNLKGDLGFDPIMFGEACKGENVSERVEEFKLV
jgi:hypothetical protein